MQKRPLLKTLLMAALMMSLAACTSHKRAGNGPNGMGGAYGPNGHEAYTQGIGSEDAHCGTVLSSKCRPGRPVPGAEQHYFFDFDSNDVRPDAINSIQMQASYIMKHPNAHVRLEGNTDDVGSREYNVALGERRARSVLDVLRQAGVSASQITVVSYGAEKPAAGGDDEQSHQCNRRVDLKYTD